MRFRDRQRGVVTVVGAIFILITLALMVSVLHRTTGGDILNTTEQGDAVEALFLAETGIEHASYRYAVDGIACADLDTSIGATSAGRGSFDVTDAFIVGTDCRVTVRGQVSSVAAPPSGAAARTLVADLRLNGGFVLAVGANDTILRWDGTAWSPENSNTTNVDFYGVHCPSANECWAVGTRRTIVRWDGSGWTVEDSESDGYYTSVACEPSNPANCYAVGYDPLVKWNFQSAAKQWNGSSWSTSGSGIAWDFFNAISCPDSNCYAVTQDGDAYTSASNWSNNDALFATTVPQGIDCFSSIDCWAVGSRPSSGTFGLYRRDASGWSPDFFIANSRAQTLYDVSCADASNCKAVGADRSNRFTIISWDGSNWTVESLLDSTFREDLNGVYCIAADNCWAVGDHRNGRATGNSLFWDGANWVRIGTPVTEDLFDVFTVDGGGGAGGTVSLVRWQEQVVN